MINGNNMGNVAWGRDREFYKDQLFWCFNTMKKLFSK